MRERPFATLLARKIPMIVAVPQAVVPCPDPEQLRQLVLGLLPDDVSERLEEHVENCDRCGGRLSSLSAEDELVEAVRAQASLADAHATSTALEQLTLRL